MKELEVILDKNGLIVAFLFVGLLTWATDLISKKVLNGRVPGSALAIGLGLVLGYLGGLFTEGENGLADLSYFRGLTVLGGSLFRDFAIVATATGASFLLIRKSGLLGLVSLVLGIGLFFFLGASLAWVMGYRDVVSLCTIGAGACTYIVGPVTGGALGASSEVIALSIGTGVVKTIAVTIFTPMMAKWIGLDSPGAAMAYGGIMGTSSGVAAGLAATDPQLVPYGSVTATFYTGLGCLICPSLFYLVLSTLLG
ncbi:MAG: malonate transporter subunit MadM [Algoriphagus sp.]|jgi:malonate transporter MadM subunit|uniref:malonate transporter subunit MadM n=1 Tax=Algoriphagus sp. TaxID=1872435 RepID=UPI002751555B|nr:malonate transporter subunit MadM [Algoriphagus sp.]MDP4748481.1 malonate transporter subunit MadM [Algoriphagus sp.]MDP4837962.1 malonate transporter subunit MadM [Algoriphagus sp.]MDP4905424.1 malonate transporter subunit MadM [Algoriphagus sp.]MDP4957536.1 malonate transporter subunit MadM [Algoriphagus sp.]